MCRYGTSYFFVSYLTLITNNHNFMQIFLHLCAYTQESIFIHSALSPSPNYSSARVPQNFSACSAFSARDLNIHSALSPLSKLFLCESSTELLSALSVLSARLKYSPRALSSPNYSSARVPQNSSARSAFSARD